jgi:hypothetical protein
VSDPEREGPTSGDFRHAQAAFDTAKRETDKEAERLPPVDFATLVLSLHHSARVHLGDAPSPADEKTAVNLPLARQTIDLIALLRDKTHGNLNGEEERIVEQALYDLRMRYVEVTKSK